MYQTHQPLILFTYLVFLDIIAVFVLYLVDLISRRYLHLFKLLHRHRLFLIRLCIKMLYVLFVILRCHRQFLSAQPVWIDCKDRKPEAEGDYYVIAEASEEAVLTYEAGTIFTESTYFQDNSWLLEDDNEFKVLFWAKPIAHRIPFSLHYRKREGYL